MLYKRTIHVEATQWFKHGDHDSVKPVPDEFKHFTPYLEGATGYIKDGDNGYFVKPGYWILKCSDGKFRPMSNDDFMEEYELVNE